MKITKKCSFFLAHLQLIYFQYLLHLIYYDVMDKIFITQPLDQQFPFNNSEKTKMYFNSKLNSHICTLYTVF